MLEWRSRGSSTWRGNGTDIICELDNNDSRQEHCILAVSTPLAVHWVIGRARSQTHCFEVNLHRLHNERGRARASSLTNRMQNMTDSIHKYGILLASHKVQYAAAALIVIWLFRNLFSSWGRLPPSPPSLPIIGHLHLLGKHPHISLQQLAKKYGPVMSIRLGQRLCIVASSPETAKEFLKNQDANCCSRPYKVSATHLLYNRQDIATQDYTANQRYLKKIFMVELVGAHRVQAYQQAREAEVAYMLSSIHQKCSQGDIEVRTHLGVLMFNTISHMVLNKRYIASSDNVHESAEKEEEAKDVREMVVAYFYQSFLFVPGELIPSLKWFDLCGYEAGMKKLAKRLDAFASKMVHEHRERRKIGPVPESERDMVDAMLDIIEEGSKDENQISEENMKAVILDAYLGGMDTAMVTTEWALAELLCNPWVMAKAQAELDNVVGRDRMVQESDIQRLPYLQVIVKETFRLHPPVPLLAPHYTMDACKAFGYDIPAKSRLFMNVWAIGRDPAVWEEPLAFNPDRFLQGKHSRRDVRGLDFELLPFGSGRRMCPAVTLGTTIVQLNVASLLQAFNWSLPDNMNPMDLDMTDSFGLTVPKAIPLRAAATPRLQQHLYQLKRSNQLDAATDQ